MIIPLLDITKYDIPKVERRKKANIIILRFDNSIVVIVAFFLAKIYLYFTTLIHWTSTNGLQLVIRILCVFVHFIVSLMFKDISRRFYPMLNSSDIKSNKKTIYLFTFLEITIILI